jgi:hypothetical protein
MLLIVDENLIENEGSAFAAPANDDDDATIFAVVVDDDDKKNLFWRQTAMR